MAVVTAGMKADITLVNCTVVEVPVDGIFFHVQMPVDANGEVVNLWIPNDTRISVIPSVPANWPPHVGDVWRVGPTGPTAWVVDKGDGTLFFCTVSNIKNHTTPISTDQALSQFGTTLQMVTRVV